MGSKNGTGSKFYLVANNTLVGITLNIEYPSPVPPTAAPIPQPILPLPIPTPFSPLGPNIPPPNSNSTLNYTFSNISFVPDIIFLSFPDEDIPQAELGSFNGTGSVTFLLVSLIEYDPDMNVVAALLLRTMVKLNDTVFATWRFRPNATDFVPPLENITIQNSLITVEMRPIVNDESYVIALGWQIQVESWPFIDADNVLVVQSTLNTDSPVLSSSISTPNVSYIVQLQFNTQTIDWKMLFLPTSTIDGTPQPIGVRNFDIAQDGVSTVIVTFTFPSSFQTGKISGLLVAANTRGSGQGPPSVTNTQWVGITFGILGAVMLLTGASVAAGYSYYLYRWSILEKRWADLKHEEVVIPTPDNSITQTF